MADEATTTTTTETPAATTTVDVADAAQPTALGAADATAPAEGEEQPAAAAEATTEAAKPAEGAEEEAAAAAAEVPETYELTLEGVTLDEAMIAEATPVFKELGLSNDQANKLMPVAQKFAEQIGNAHNQQILDGVAKERKAWLDTAKADPEIGGQNWDANLVTAAKALDSLGFNKGSPFRALLDDSGLGNHPEMIRAFVKIGKAIGEDSDFVRAGGATTGPRSHADILYPSSKS